MPVFLDRMPEVFVSNAEISALVSQAVRQGKLRQIGSRLYTKNMEEAPERIVLRNWYLLLKEYYPDALIADRTALENKPAADGSVFIISSKKRAIILPGVIFKPRKGSPPLESDRPFLGGVYLSSMARAYLENMRISRPRTGEVARTLSRAEIEERIDGMLRRNGEEAVNRLRDEAREIAAALDMHEEFQKLDTLIGGLLGTRDSKAASAVGFARQKGCPYDSERVDLFLELCGALRDYAALRRPAGDMSAEARVNLAFFEAYFSNFIEGTEFAVEEAADIVFSGLIPDERPEDAHDILGTFRIVSDAAEMSRAAKNFSEFVQILRARHAVFMEMRPEKLPGQFKTRVNVAGSTQFVAPDLVVGTLEKGFEISQALENPFSRAVYMMFLVSEVHPFADGNGRAARIMMNAALVAGGEQKIIIPTIYRNNYLSALKALTHNGLTEPLIRTLDFAQEYTQAIDWSDYTAAWQALTATHAFEDPNEAESKAVRLTLFQRTQDV